MSHIHTPKSMTEDKIAHMSVEKIKNALHNAGLTSLIPILMMITGVSLFAISDVLFKLMGSDLNPMTIAFGNDLIALAMIVLISLKIGGLKQTLQSRYKKWHILRSCCFSITFFILLTTYPHMPLANVYAILFIWPLVATILSILFLGEKAQRHHWISLAIGFIGILIILRPGPDGFNGYTFLALTAAITISCGMTLSRKIPSSEPNISHAFYPILTTLILSGIAVIFVWEAPSITHIAYLGLTGTLGTFAVMLIGMAFARGNTAVLSPFEYTKMFWAVVLGYLVFGDTLSPITAIGTLLIIASGIYLITCEQRTVKS